MINRLIYKLGMNLRNPSLNKQFQNLMRTDKYDYNSLKQIQLIRLKKLLLHAKNYSPYYSHLFEEYNFNPEQVKTIDDILILPVISKSELIANNNLIQSTYKFNKTVFSETSGTTGQPLTIYRSESWDSGTRAAMFRGYTWYDVCPWEKNGYFWGYNIDKKAASKIEFLDKLQNRFRLFSYDEKSIVDFCSKLKDAAFISGYSSMIYEVAKKINRLGLSNQFPNLKMIKGTSEKIWPAYQDEVNKAFGMKMISEYGSMETGIIAFECPSGSMHIAMEHVILEEIDGAAVVTNLLSYSFPIIRYKLGDAIQLANKEFRCPCGREHPVLIDVLGRVGSSVYGYNSKYPSLTFYYVFKNITFLHEILINYQAVQNTKGEIVLNIEQVYSERIDNIIKEELYKYFKDDVTFTIYYSSRLHKMNGKLKDFIQNINDNE